MKGSSDYWMMDVDMLFVIVIGSEGFGMSCLVCEKCDFFVYLLMCGKVILFNVFVVVSLLFYEVYWKCFFLEK